MLYLLTKTPPGGWGPGILINHINKYPLLTQKQADFLLFKQVIELINNKVHLTLQGLNEIVGLRASMNLGLSDKLKLEFKEVIAVDRPEVALPTLFQRA